MTRAHPHPTALALLDAGIRLAESRSLAGLSVNDIVAEAGVAKGTFYVHFQDRTAYLLALHQRFHDALRDLIGAAMAGQAPGIARLRSAFEAYLDGCREQRGVKALLLEARAEPSMVEQVLRTNDAFGRMLKGELAAAGWAEAASAARLFVAMVAEIALAELESGKRQMGLRRQLWRFLDLPV